MVAALLNEEGVFMADVDNSFIPRGMKISGNILSGGDLCVEGDVYGDVMIDGTLELRGNVRGKHIKVGRVELTSGVIESDIECADYISVGEGVTILGNVSAGDADIEGAINGDVIVENKVSIGNTAVIKGKVRAGEVSVDLGAVCEVGIENASQERKASEFFENYLKEHSNNN